MARKRTIIRVKRRDKPFAVIDRRLLEDARLSWAARGVLGYLLAKPDDWTLKVEDLRRRGDLGRDALYKILKQLQRAGYLRRELTRNADARVSGVVYTVFEVPEARFPEKPDTAQPAPARPTLLNNYRTKEPVNQETTTTDDNNAERPRGGEALVFPDSLPEPTVGEARRTLAPFSLPLAQALIDELAGRMQANAIHGSPLAYLRGLTKRAQSGDFAPQAGLSIADERAHRRRVERAVRRAPASLAPVPPADESNPFAPRVNQIRPHQTAGQPAGEHRSQTPRRDRDP